MKRRAASYSLSPSPSDKQQRIEKDFIFKSAGDPHAPPILTLQLTPGS